MPLFKVNYEEIVSYTCSVEVRAKNTEEAIELARDIKPTFREEYDSTYTTFDVERLSKKHDQIEAKTDLKTVLEQKKDKKVDCVLA